jgi:hypothetical protein
MREALGGRDIAEFQQAVVALLEEDAFLFELPGQPVPAIDADLNVEREPRLEPDVHEAEKRMHVVMIIVQALAWAHEEFEFFRGSVWPDFITDARLGGAKNADKARRDPVTLGDGAGMGFFVAAAKRFQRSARGLCHLVVGLPNLLGGSLDIRLEALEGDPHGIQEAGHSSVVGQSSQGAAET